MGSGTGAARRGPAARGLAGVALAAALIAGAGRLRAETIFSTFGSGTGVNESAWYAPPATAQCFRTSASGYLLTDIWLPLAKDPALDAESQQRLTVTVVTSGTDGRPGNVVSGTVGSLLVATLPVVDAPTAPTQQTAVHFSNVNLALAPETSYWLQVATDLAGQNWYAYKSQVRLYTVNVNVGGNPPTNWIVPDINFDYAMSYTPADGPAAIITNPIVTGSESQWTALTATITAVPEPSQMGLVAGLVPLVAVWVAVRQRRGRGQAHVPGGK